MQGNTYQHLFHCSYFHLVHHKVGIDDIDGIDDIGDIDDFDIFDDNNLSCDLCEDGDDYDNWHFIRVVNWSNC